MKKSLIPLVIVAAVLVGLVVLKNSSKPPARVLDQARLVSLIPDSAAASDVERIELYSGAAPDDKIVLARDADSRDEWLLASYYDAPADPEKMDTLLEDLLKLRGQFRTAASDEAGLAAYDLGTEAALHVAAYGKEGDAPIFHILVGKSPDYKSVFMRTEGDLNVYTETTNLRQSAGMYGEANEAPKAANWLDKTALDLDKESVESIAMSVPGKSVTFKLEEQEVPAAEDPAEAEETEGEAAAAPPAAEPVKEWVVAEGGPGTEFKSQGINNILARLDSLAASDVADPAQKAELGLDPPMFTMTVGVAGQEAPVVLHAGRKDPAGDGYLVVESADPNLVYQVASYNFNNLFPKAGDLFTLPKPAIDEEVTRLEVTGPDGKAVLTKDAETWTVVEPKADLPIQVSAASGITGALSSWQPADYAASPEGTGVDSPKATVTFTAGDATHTLKLGNDTEAFDGAYVQFDDGMVLAMNRTDLNRIFKKPADFYQLNLTTLTTGEVQSVDVFTPEGEYLLNREGSNWSMLIDGEPAPAPVNVDEVEMWLEAVTGLRGEGIVPGATAIEGEPISTISLGVEGSDLITIQIGPGETTRPVLVSNIPQVVTIEAATADEVLRDGASFLAELSEVTADEPAAENPAEGEAAPAAEVSVEVDAAPAEEAPAETESAPQ